MDAKMESMLEQCSGSSLEEAWEEMKGSRSDWRKAEESGLETVPTTEEWSGQAKGLGMAGKMERLKDSKSVQAWGKCSAGMKDRASVKTKVAASVEA